MTHPSGWRRRCANRWFALVISILIVASLGGLMVATLTVVISEGLLLNEDQAAVLYLLGIPLSVAFGFAAITRVYRSTSDVGMDKQSIIRGILLAPIIYSVLERGSIFTVFASGYLEPSRIGWGLFVAGIWAITMMISGSVWLLSAQRSTSPTAVS